jgi:hypothetical protein
MTYVAKLRDKKGRVSYQIITKGEGESEGEVTLSPEDMADFLLEKLQQEEPKKN